MKKLLGIVVLSLFLITPSWADDIRDFEIEGMSVGDSLLDYFSEEKIKDNIFKTTYKSKEYSKVELYNQNTNSKIYDGLQFYFKKNDEKYIIYSLSGHLMYKKNIEACFEKQEEIIREITELFQEAKTERVTLDHQVDKSRKSKVYAVFFDFPSGDYARIECSDYSEEIEKKYGWVDNLRVNVSESEFVEWLDRDSY